MYLANPKPANPGKLITLETDPPAEKDTLLSFLINALYLFGGQVIAAPGTPSPVLGELARLGHRVASLLPEGKTRAHRSADFPHGSGGKPPARKFDRIFLAETLGSEADPAGRLRALRGALRPGGLVGFQVLDRDRAWERTGLRASAAVGASPGIKIDFDPASGKLIALAAETAEGRPAPRRVMASLQTWNLGELKGLLRAAGLELERAYGDWDASAPGTGSGRLIVVAARPRIRRKPRSSRRKPRYSPSSTSASAPTSSESSTGSSEASKAATLATRSWGEKGLARKPAKASPTSSATPSVAP
jgi:Methyltransferase domain